MKTELVLFGRRFKMASRTRRRRLVVLVFASLAAFIGCSWFVDRWHDFSIVCIVFAPSLVNRIFFGGYDANCDGLVKPFDGNEVYSQFSRNKDTRRFRFYRWFMPWISIRRLFHNDERDLRQRDHAHWLAYKRMSGLVGIAFIVAYLKNTKFYSFDISSFPFDQVIYGLLIICYVLSSTLPQAILLWTEPDMEEAQ
jgi:hypothetical protein